IRTFSLRTNAASSRSRADFIPLICSGSWRSPSSGERKRAAASGSSIPRPTSRSASTGKAEGDTLSFESCSAASRTLAFGEFSGLAIHRMRRRKTNQAGCFHSSEFPKAPEQKISTITFSLLVLVRCVDHESAGIIRQFAQLLIMFVPFRARFIDKNASLVRPSELHETGLPDVSLQPAAF